MCYKQARVVEPSGKSVKRKARISCRVMDYKELFRRIDREKECGLGKSKSSSGNVEQRRRSKALSREKQNIIKSI